MYQIGLARDLNLLIEQSRMVIARDAPDAESDIRDDVSTISSISSSDEHSVNGACEVDYGLVSIIQSLMNLAPAIENNLAQVERQILEAKHTSASVFNVSLPAQIYVSHVRDKFKKAPTRLVERLGEANWQRHILVRARMDQGSALSEDKETILSAYKPRSMFHDSGLGTTISTKSRYAASMASHTSFLSSVADQEGGSVRVPPTPPEISACKPFTCFICGHIQKKLKNRVDWK